MYDFKEREKRKNNVIIYNLPEPLTDDNEDRNERKGQTLIRFVSVLRLHLVLNQSIG